MNIPFTVEQFFGISANYNAQIWPVQVVAYAIGLAAVGALWATPQRSKGFVFAVLAAFWAWNGIAYQYMFFAAINPAAKSFGALVGTSAAVVLGVPQDLGLAVAALVIAMTLAAYGTGART